MKCVDVLPGETKLDRGGVLRFEPEWLPRSEADALLRDLRASVGWTQGAITMFGRDLLEPRLTAWVGDADYTYSGRTMRAAPWSGVLAELRARIEQFAGARFNAVLLNLYRGGQDSMGMHSDDEPELGPDPIIASASLGATRTFVLAPKNRRARESGAYAIALGHGSLLVMSGPTQHRYRHGVPKEPGFEGERINLTFRRIVTP